ncbi:MAG: bifunctional homocysteine S-methyltransferase/methylenetetrahydrofolate reductase [Bacilli bacterium]|jgi:homocysteine S-methyltransferase|nr:bifunctional homocysteine S-methyltransferase/methylenetetrahydrofolate reductase [Bacilli bacterium]
MNKKIPNKYLDYIFDGAYGTYFASKYKQNQPIELCNITHAKEIINIHQEYIDAGVNAIKTNTFRLNTNLIKDVKYRNLLIVKAIKNAKKACKDKKVNIFADIGPIDIDENNKHEYLDIVNIFLENGINKFLFETNIEFESIKESVKYIKDNVKDSVVIVSFSVNQDGYTQLGNYYLKLCEEVSSIADYFGLNCICGPTHMYQLAQNIDMNKYNVSLMPNAGYPELNHEPLYDYNPDYFSDVLLKMASLDTKIIGGCCGSTPEHIKKFIEKINTTPINYQLPKQIKIIDSKKESDFYQKLKSDKKVILVELEPPIDTDIDYLYDAIYKYKALNIDLITLVDSPLGKTRADSLMIASKIKQELNVDILVHQTCRDKNQIALKGGLLAANINGINNVLALSGDAIAQIDRENKKGVFNFNSFNLINYINELNQTTFYNNPYLIGSALNINASNFDNELIRAKKKISLGTKYFITQSIFSYKAIDNLKKAFLELDVPIIVGFYPIVSYKNAMFLNNEVKGIKIPDSLIKELKESDSNNYQVIVKDYILDIIGKVKDYCHGYYISTPLKKVNYVCDIIKAIKLNN